MFGLKRQSFLGVLLCAVYLLLAQAHAKDGDSGSSNSGPGGGYENSGSGGGGDDDDEDEREDNDDNDSRASHSRDHDRALKALKKGKVVSLQVLQRHLQANYPGHILRVDLKSKSGVYFYKVRILSPGNRIRALSLNALTLKAGEG